MNSKLRLVCHKVIFYSQKDEDAFFEWIQNIKCIENFLGVGNKLYLYIKSKRLGEHDLRDLLALFRRYKVKMKQLAIFLNNSNKQWFYENKKAYWHKTVFGANKSETQQ